MLFRSVTLMKKLGISNIADNDINEVSGGQLQRACICRSLINNPKIIFADEPTGALNQQTSNEVMKEFNRINAEGTTIMMVTHSEKVAARSDKIIYIEDGEIKGQLQLGKFTPTSDRRSRERELNHLTHKAQTNSRFLRKFNLSKVMLFAHLLYIFG